MRDQILRVVQEALHGGSRRMKLILKREEIKGANYLRLMDLVGCISLSKDTKSMLKDVVRFGKWNCGSDCIVCITIADKFDCKWFVDCMHDVLEDIEVERAN